MKELDLLLERFLERGFEDLDEQQLARFETLLESPDQDLFSWLGGADPGDEELARLVCRIRQCIGVEPGRSPEPSAREARGAARDGEGGIRRLPPEDRCPGEAGQREGRFPPTSGTSSKDVALQSGSAALPPPPTSTLSTRGPTMSEHRIPRLGATAGDEEIRDSLKREGCVIFENVIDHDIIDRMLAELRPYMERKPTGNGDFSGFHTKRLHSLFAKSEELPAFILHPKVTQAADLALLPFCDSYQLNSNSITAIGPGETVQPLHRDDLLYPLAHPSERNACCTAFWALTDFTAENGATRLIPGSHLWDDARVPQESETVQALMPKGSVCFFVGALYHGGGANHSAAEWRVGMFQGYCLGWLRQEQNFYLTVPPEKAREMPEALARLLGYNLHRPFLGWVQDFQDPWDAINGYQELSSGGSDLFAEGASRPIQGAGVRLV